MAKEVNIWLRIVVDFICLLTVGLPLLVLFLIGQPFERGLYCDDETIRYPYKKNTISNPAVICVGVLVPPFIMLLTESVRYHRNLDLHPPSRRFHPLLVVLYNKVGIFAFGCLLCQMSTDIAKYTIGRLRPHFWTVCDPDIVCAPNDHTFITNFECKSGKTDLIREARLSFLSGHSSFSAFTMLYLTLYMQSRMKFPGFKLLRPFLQGVALYAAWYTGLSRVSDYQHHWGDVLSGFLMGTTVSLLVVFFLSDLFPKRRIRSEWILAARDESKHREDDHVKDPEKGS